MNIFRIIEEGCLTPDGEFVRGVAVLPGDSVCLEDRGSFELDGVMGIPGAHAAVSGVRGKTPYVPRLHALKAIGGARSSGRPAPGAIGGASTTRETIAQVLRREAEEGRLGTARPLTRRIGAIPQELVSAKPAEVVEHDQDDNDDSFEQQPEEEFEEVKPKPVKAEEPKPAKKKGARKVSKRGK